MSELPYRADTPAGQIRVMMLYSNKQRHALGGISNFQMETELAQALTRSNVAMEHSEIPLHFTAVYYGQVFD